MTASSPDLQYDIVMKRNVWNRVGNSFRGWHLTAYVLSALAGAFFGLASPARAEDLCYNLDACSEDLLCHYISGSWVKVAPCGFKLYRSGPVHQVTCVRLVFDGADCSGSYHRDDYYSNSCGLEYTPPGGRSKACCGQ